MPYVTSDSLNPEELTEFFNYVSKNTFGLALCHQLLVVSIRAFGLS